MLALPTQRNFTPKNNQRETTLHYTFSLSPFTTNGRSKMKYIHSSETLTVPEGGEYNFSPVEAGGRAHETFRKPGRALGKPGEQSLTSFTQ